LGGSREHGNEPSGSIKRWKILKWQLVASQEGLSSMKLVQLLMTDFFLLNNTLADKEIDFKKISKQVVLFCLFTH
jgi:hypothetical protein